VSHLFRLPGHRPDSPLLRMLCSRSGSRTRSAGPAAVRGGSRRPSAGDMPSGPPRRPPRRPSHLAGVSYSVSLFRHASRTAWCRKPVTSQVTTGSACTRPGRTQPDSSGLPDLPVPDSARRWRTEPPRMACKRSGVRVSVAPRFRRSKAICADLDRLLIVQEVSSSGELA
jgi:hypothetical protein